MLVGVAGPGEAWQVSAGAALAVAGDVAPFAVRMAKHDPDPDPDDEIVDEPGEELDDELDEDELDGDLDDDLDEEYPEIDEDLIDLDDEWDGKDEEDRHENPHKFYE